MRGHPADRSLSVTQSGHGQPMGAEQHPTPANQDRGPVEEPNLWVLIFLYVLPPTCIISLIASFPNHKHPVLGYF
jgi:hypothetical protein